MIPAARPSAPGSSGILAMNENLAMKNHCRDNFICPLPDKDYGRK
jgi:hypothetical protein